MQFSDNRPLKLENKPSTNDIWQQRYNALEHNSNAQNFDKFCEELLRHPDKTYTSVVGKLREHSHGKLSPEEDRLKDRDAWARTTFGKNDQMVARAQASLAMAGYELGDYGVKGVDGIPGPKTEKAIKEFQVSIGLKPTGKLDQETMKALDLATAKGLTKKEIEQIGKNIAKEVHPVQKPVEPLQTKELKPEAMKRLEVRADLVKNLDFSKGGNYQLAQGQASLKMAGYELGKHGIDGKMGPDTSEAMKEFQKDRGLPQTGKLDVETYHELNRATAEGWKRPENKNVKIEKNPIKEKDYGKIDYNFEKELEKFPPSYREALQKLHELHPNWQFEAFKTNVKWNEFITAEDKGGLNLVNSAAKSIPSLWIEVGSKEYYPGWKAASKEIISYYADPRNFLNEKDIFQFEKLYYNPKVHNLEGVKEILKGTFMEKGDYAKYFMKAAESSGVSPYYLASKARLEMGSKGCSLSKGTVKGYENCYNFYNVGACGTNPVLNGAKTAKANGWDTPEKAIIEGAQFCAKEYIFAGQETMYESKFDFVGTKYTHQYVQNIQAAYIEGQKYYDGHLKGEALDKNIIIKIPIFEDMPDKLSLKP